MITVGELKELFGCNTDQELGDIFGRKRGVVSVWRKSGVPPAIEMRAVELLGGASNGTHKRHDVFGMIDAIKRADPVAYGVLLEEIIEKYLVCQESRFEEESNKEDK